jgi:hypothetical protein
MLKVCKGQTETIIRLSRRPGVEFFTIDFKYVHFLNTFIELFYICELLDFIYFRYEPCNRETFCSSCVSFNR